MTENPLAAPNSKAGNLGKIENPVKQRLNGFEKLIEWITNTIQDGSKAG
jgi:hypothetical protein